MSKILITDTLFVFKEHEDKIRAAGYEIERLEKSNPTESELIEAIRDKVGYILGGVEAVTEKMVARLTNSSAPRQTRQPLCPSGKA